MTTTSARSPEGVTRPNGTAAGRVVFVGSGPGDPELLTLAAVSALSAADKIVCDRDDLRPLLDHPAITLAADVEIITLGRQPSGKLIAPSARAKSVQRLADGGRSVVRLVAGDPFMDGGVADEAAACLRAGVDFEVVPGVPSATSVPAYAGVALAPHASHFVTATDRVSKAVAGGWATTGTLVVTTTVGLLAHCAEMAVGAGRGEAEAVLVTVNGGSTDQASISSTLGELPRALAKLAKRPDEPAHLMVGEAVEHRGELSWFETKPLFGWRVLVPRTKDQAAPLAQRLRSYGANSEDVPTISVEPPRSPVQMEKAVRGLVEGRFAWVCFTSVNAVRAVREKFESFGLDARDMGGLKVAAVGETTSARLREWGIEPDLVPTAEQSSAGLVAEFPSRDEDFDPIERVLLPRADIATETLSSGLTGLGWEVEDVTAYRTVRAAPPPAEVREAIKTGDFDAVVFTSSSTVRNLIGIAGKPHASTVIAAIGPATAQTCEEYGLRVDVLADRPKALALGDALAAHAAARRDQFVAAGKEPLKPSETRRRRRKP